MYAEALNEISYSNLQNSEALVALNAVHTRAGLSPDFDYRVTRPG